MVEGNWCEQGGTGRIFRRSPPARKDRPMRRPFLLLAALTLAFFAPLLLRPAATLYSAHSDLLAEHLPAKCFLTRSWRETGELPLWNPHHFCGSPFIHDLPVA